MSLCCRDLHKNRLARGLFILVVVESLLCSVLIPTGGEFINNDETLSENVKLVLHPAVVFGPSLVLTVIGVIVVCRVRCKRKFAMQVSAIRTLATSPHDTEMPLLLGARAVEEDINDALRRYVDRGEPSHNATAIAQRLIEHRRGHDSTGVNVAQSSIALTPTAATSGTAQPLRPDRSLLVKVEGMLRTAADEIEALMNAAARSGDFVSAASYQEQLTLVTSVVSPDGSDEGDGIGNTSPKVECVVPGLLLRTDRFDSNSGSFLGRGGSAAVSLGTLVEQIGRKEVRTTVAVKEIPKTGAQSERKAVHESLLLRRHLREGHPSIIKIFDVKSNSSAFFVVMQHCAFSLATAPASFLDFLEGPNGNKMSKRRQDDNTDTDEDGTLNTGGGPLVLGALVRDLLNAVSFLHSKHIVHCDIKVCSF